MSLEKDKPSIWSALGKAGVIVGLIWGGIQIYNYFFKANDYEASGKGNHSFYQTSPIILDGYNKSIKYKALAKTIVDKKGILNNPDLDALVKKYKDDYNFNYNYDKINPNRNYYWTDYSSVWVFSIKNEGTKPLEELALELPFDGHYNVFFPNNTNKTDAFKNKIELGEIRPSYEIKIICWTDYNMYDIESDEEKSRFTHKNGWFAINYPVEVTGLYAWNKKNHNAPLFIFGFIIFTLFLIIFGVGESIGMEKGKKVVKISDIQPEHNNNSEK